MNASIESFGESLWQASWHASVLAILLGVMLLVLRDQIAPRWRHLLWSVVLIRFLMIVVPASSWSLFNTLPGRGQVEVETVPPDLVEPRPTRVETMVAASTPTPTVATEGPAVQIVSQQAQPAREGTGILDRPAPAMEPPRTWTAKVSAWSLVVIVWALGASTLGLRLVLSCLALRRLMRVTRPCTNDAINRLLADAAAQHRLSQPPALLVTGANVGPCVVGMLRPRVLVPEALLGELSAEQWRQVFLHEVAHMRRRDVAMNWLLLLVRTLHWFNPCAWWVVARVRAESEAACDDAVLALSYEPQRRQYAEAIIKVGDASIWCSLTPGLVGFRMQHSLVGRVKSVLRGPCRGVIGPRLTFCAVLAIIAIGFTGARPVIRAAQQAAAKAETSSPVATGKRDFAIAGTVVEPDGKTPLANVRLQLFETRNLIDSPKSIAESTSDATGEFVFDKLEAPASEGPRLLFYHVVATPEGRPAVIGNEWWTRMSGEMRGRRGPATRTVMTIEIPRKTTTRSGRVVDSQGRPVAGARVFPNEMHTPHIREIHEGVTNANGEFTVTSLAEPAGPNAKWPFFAEHPDFPVGSADTPTIAGPLVITMPAGCIVTGNVIDQVTSQPAAGVILEAQLVGDSREYLCRSDAGGKFRMAVPEGNYHFVAKAEDRVCSAILDQECLRDSTVEIAALNLVQGGRITGQVLNTATGKPVAVTNEGNPIGIGLIGPSHPSRRVISPESLALVDEQGRFDLLAAPGENFPYFVNEHGSRMAWDTKEQPPVIVKEGEQVVAVMTITPKETPAQKMERARAVLKTLPEPRDERVAAILQKFRDPDLLKDGDETWCLLMKEIITIGSPGVPAICRELDSATETRPMRFLPFVLRAIGDPRAVPALIRVIPRSIMAPGGDHGRLVDDAELMAFMQQHDLEPGKGSHFDLGRPMREVFGALEKLTKHNIDWRPLNFLLGGEDPNRKRMLWAIAQAHAVLWQNWWEAHWQEFTKDEAYHLVNLREIPVIETSAKKELGTTSRIGGGSSGSVVSPADETNPYATRLLDLDTGLSPAWPSNVPATEEGARSPELLAWAREHGVDLTCVIRTSSSGKPEYVLRPIDLQVVRISPQDARNLEKRMKLGEVPKGTPAGEFLGLDDATADGKPSFLYVTKEGSHGMIEITDLITRTQDLTGTPSGMAPRGTGFHRGVQFDHHEIVP